MKIVKPDEVYLDHNPDWGWCFMNKDWEVVAILDKEGNIFVKGVLYPKHEFGPAEIDENGNVVQAGDYGKINRFTN